MNYDIFISYRHEGGVDKAHIVHQHLCSLGYTPFFDHYECRKIVGEFETKILAAIQTAPVFLLLLSPGCFDHCNNNNNWVRREIEHALKHSKDIIPITITGDRFDFNSLPPDAPDSIKGLQKLQFTEIDFGTNFSSTIDELVEKIRKKSNVKPSIIKADTTTIGARIHFSSDIPCRVFDYGKQIALTDPMDEFTDSSLARLLEGRHKIEYKSIENEADSYKDILTIKGNDMEDFVEIKLAGIKEERLKKEKILRENEKRIAKQERARAKQKSNFKHDYFFIYSNKDALIVRQIKEYLEAAGYSCWIEPHDKVAETSWHGELTRSQYVLYFHSAHSVQSRYVKAEVHQANEANKKIKLIKLDDTPHNAATLQIFGNTRGIKVYCREDIQSLFTALLDSQSDR